MVTSPVETWRPIPSHPGYEASSLAGIRSVDRVVQTRRGPQRWRGRPRRTRLGNDGYRIVELGHGQVRKVCNLVAEAFHGPRPEGAHVLHGPNGQADDTPSNLRYGTRSDNMRDRVRDGTCPQSRRKRCPLDHPLAAPNLAEGKLARGRRQCKACHQTSAVVSRLRRNGVVVTPDRWRAIADERYARIAGVAA